MTLQRVDSELLPLAAVAAELHVAVELVRRWSREGKFPALLRATQKHYLVRRADFEAWKANRWTTASDTRTAIVAEAVKGARVNRRRKGGE